LKTTGVRPYVKGNDRTALMASMMNKIERSSGEAVVQYLDSNLRIVKPGAFVRCAVTGQQIPLDELKYWSVELQEPYATPEAVMQRIAGELSR
jgi:hypothetical protein